MYCFAGCHVGVVGVCRLLSFAATSPHARVCGDCLVVGGLGCREVFEIDVSFPCRVVDLDFRYCIFG